jgi:serine/threonine protein kinase
VVEEALEDQHRRHLVHGLLPVPPPHATFDQGTRRFRGGEALVPLVDGKPEGAAEVGGEGLHLLRLRSQRPVEAAWEAHHDLRDPVLAHERPYCLHVLARADAGERGEAAGDRRGLVGECYTDPNVAHVEAEDTHADEYNAALLKYRILHELGAGGMGTVFKGLLVGQAGFQRPLVIKQVRNPAPDQLRMFVEEARRYALLDHENIGRIFDFEEVRGEPCIILEYIDGWTVVELLERHCRESQPPDVELSVFIASRVCRALQYVFERAAIVHRDISPSNIMMTSEGTVKLIDFGIATRSGTRDSALTGKPSYMAPEMVVELRADHRSDIFSLGAVLFEMLTLERLFRGKTAPDVLEQVVGGHIARVRDRNPAVPKEVAAIVDRALQRDPDRRFPSAAAMGDACEHYLYDKGYGPTNLTLKRHLAALFPSERPATVDDSQSFPAVQPTLIPISDGPTPQSRATAPIDGVTRVSPAATGYTRVVTERPAMARRTAKLRSKTAKLPSTRKLPKTRRTKRPRG